VIRIWSSPIQEKARCLLGRLPLLGVLAIFSFGGDVVRAEQSRGIVSITFDDGAKVQYDYGLLLAQELRLPGTIFLPTGLVRERADTPQDSWIMAWDDVLKFHEAGWEIGVHGHTHVRLPDLKAEQLETELVQPILEVETRTGVRPVSFSSPFGAFSDETIARIMAHYDYHLSWKGFGGRNPIEEVDPSYIGRLEVTHEMEAVTVCGEMVRAAQNDVWLVLLIHGLVEGTPGEYEVSVSTYREILSCAAYLDDAGIIDVVTVRDAMARVVPE
jgi:peptidoglycan/xylan/chitin deacetylase (PgdA/CDA1 family)